MRTPAQLRSDLADILADLPRVLAQDMPAEERREYLAIQEQTTLRLANLDAMDMVVESHGAHRIARRRRS